MRAMLYSQAVPRSALKLQEFIPLAPYTMFCIGGPARFFCEVEGEAELAEAVSFAKERNLPLFVLGGGSNLLVSDAGFDGVVLRVGVAVSKGEHQNKGSVLLEVDASEN